MCPYFYVPWSLILACTLLLSSIYALRTFFLLYIMLLQLKAKVPLFCVCTPINHSPLPALSFLLFFRIKLFYIFIFFLLFQTVGYTIVYTIIFQQHFHIFCSIFINKHSVFTHLTHGQILLEFLQFKHRKFFQTIQYVAIISHKFLIITWINVIHSRQEKRR